MNQLSTQQKTQRGQMLQDIARDYEQSRHTPKCPCCHRPYKTGAEYVEEMLADPDKLRIINALAAIS